VHDDSVGEVVANRFDFSTANKTRLAFFAVGCVGFARQLRWEHHFDATGAKRVLARFHPVPPVLVKLLQTNSARIESARDSGSTRGRWSATWFIGCELNVRKIDVHFVQKGFIPMVFNLLNVGSIRLVPVVIQCVDGPPVKKVAGLIKKSRCGHLSLEVFGLHPLDFSVIVV
jgi:hypothetical protein